MICATSVEDILSADQARRQAGSPTLLTPEGWKFFVRLLAEMKDLQLTQIPRDIAES
jgi:hypothetical protein